MKFDYESLSSEPLFYMLMHSGVFVTVLGGVFFIVGLLFGYATWGRYKRHTRELRGENTSLKHEIADLKRKLADHSIKSGPFVAMATETIHLPPKNGTVPAAASVTATPAPVENGAQAAPPVDLTAPALPVATASEPATASVALLPPSDTPPPPAPARHASPLAAIIDTPPPEKKTDESSAPDEVIPESTVPAIPSPEPLPVAPLPALEFQPDLDPQLGLIYKTMPEKADDLTALRGIAKVLEQRLNELGIYTYAQIAVWDEDHIREFSARLSFKDRIQRENWVEQARELIARQTTAVSV